MPETNGLELRDVRYRHPGGFTLGGITLTVRSSKVTTLLGPNGAGKTTLVHCICGLLQPDAGSIRVLGHDLASARSAALNAIGLVFQEQTLDSELSVMQNLVYFAALHGLDGVTSKCRGAAVLERLGLADLDNQPVRRLSGGQRRRAELARALLNAPPFLLLDEPSVGLDIPSRNALVADVHALAAEHGTSVLWTTHLVDEVWDNDDLVVLANGKVAASGSRADVLDSVAAGDVAEAFDRLTRQQTARAADTRV